MAMTLTDQNLVGAVQPLSKPLFYLIPGPFLYALGVVLLLSGLVLEIVGYRGWLAPFGSLIVAVAIAGAYITFYASSLVALARDGEVMIARSLENARFSRTDRTNPELISRAEHLGRAARWAGTKASEYQRESVEAEVLLAIVGTIVSGFGKAYVESALQSRPVIAWMVFVFGFLPVLLCWLRLMFRSAAASNPHDEPNSSDAR